MAAHPNREIHRHRPGARQRPRRRRLPVSQAPSAIPHGPGRAGLYGLPAGPHQRPPGSLLPGTGPKCGGGPDRRPGGGL